MTPLVTAAELALLESEVTAALVSGDDSSLRVLGYGEITLVVGWPTAQPRVACKRLPVFADNEAAAAYGSLVAEYVDRLRARGVPVVETQWLTTPSAGDRVAGYVVQEVLPTDLLLTDLLRRDGSRVSETVGAVLDLIDATVDEEIGLDAQLSNWAWVGGGPAYFDVTTPMLNDSAGRTRLDLHLLTSSLPAVARPPVRRFLAPGIVAAYHDPRQVVLDLVGNAHKERLSHLVDELIDLTAGRVSPPLTTAETDRFYRGNALMWEAMIRLRRADRWWQRRVRRRPYPFLLPGQIQR